MVQQLKQQPVHDVYAETRRLKSLGHSNYHVELSLFERGVSLEAASSAIHQVHQEYRKALRQEAFKKMAIGVVMAIIGVIMVIRRNNLQMELIGVEWAAIGIGAWRFISGLRLLGDEQ
jgi:hypothetical protein